jgi:membrane protein YqaA with SNARE-associated domain
MRSENDHFVRLAKELAVFPDGLHYTERMEIWMQSVLAALALPEYGLSTVFVVSLVSATLLPMGSEPVVFGLVKLNPELFWPAMLVATAGNTIGGAISWWMGSGVHKVSDKLRHKETSAQDARALRWLHALAPKPVC